MNIRTPTLNKVLIAGNLTSDPKANILENGTHVTSFRIASNRRYQNKGGEWKNNTCFVNVVCWRELAERTASNAHKGSPVLVEGELQYREWENRDGTKGSQVEILARSVQMLEKQEREQRGSDDEESGYRPDFGSDNEPDYSDDIPF